MVAPFVLIVSAAVMLTLAVWMKNFGRSRGEPARYLLAWLGLSVVAALVMAASMWMGDAKASMPLAAAARSLLMIAAFLIFVFTRSFSRGADYSLFFWSLPLQLGLAANVLNWQHIYIAENGAWLLDASDSLALTVATASWFYSILAVIYAALLHHTLRREGKDEESRRTLAMTLALLVLLAADSMKGVASGGGKYAVNAGYVGYLAGVLLLIWAFRFPPVRRQI